MPSRVVWFWHSPALEVALDVPFSQKLRAADDATLSSGCGHPLLPQPHASATGRPLLLRRTKYEAVVPVALRPSDVR